jgi:hypothetical protein
MKSSSPLGSGLSVALLSDALDDRGSIAAKNRRFSAGRAFPVGTALAGMLLVPVGAQQIGPPGAYGAPYANPYGEPYGGASPPYGSGGGYGYPQQPPPYGQQLYPQQPSAYGQQPYAPQYAQPQYGQPAGYAPPEYTDEEQGTAPQEYGQPQEGYGADQEQGQAFDPNQLEQLVAPIALYPDALLAQVVTAATYPAQVAAADAWLDSIEGPGGASPDQIAAGANAHTDWDPSVKAMTAFPQVLDMMARNLQWTTDLGNAYYNQPQDIMQTVQVLRQRAENAGNLRSTPQEPMDYENGYIQLNPPNQNTAYVPQYDPWTVYGNQISPYPGFSLAGAIGSFFSSGLGQNAIGYGIQAALGAFNQMPWGFIGWGLNWLANAVLFNHSDYFTHSTSVADWGLRYGGPRAFGRGGDWGGYGHRDLGRGGDGWDRGYRGGAGGWDRGFGGGPREAFYGGRREFSGWRGNEHLNPGFGARAGGFGRGGVPAHEAFGRPGAGFGQVPSSRERVGGFGNSFNSFGRSGNGRSYSGRPGMAFANPSHGFGAPQSYGRGNSFNGRGYGGYGGSFGKQRNSGGFHLFGGGHNSNGYGGGRSNGFFGGGHSSREFRGGGFGGGKMPRMKMPKQRSFGGGHFGGGHSGGGHFGHSGGGHSGGGHGGSHHR